MIDSDILQYEVAFAAEAHWKALHPEASPEWLADYPPDWDFVEEKLLNRIQNIEDECEATEPSVFYFSGEQNFRYDIAKTVAYKSGRGQKPFHYRNIGAFLKGLYPCREEHNLEADDLLGIESKIVAGGGINIICSRDKDLRAVAGWHYGWELGNQPRFGPFLVEGYGDLRLSDCRKKLTGWGNKFFLFQCLTGDSTDTIPGLPRVGNVGAFKLLHGTRSYEEGLGVVRGEYLKRGFSEDYLLEQGRLLWMTRELHPDGSPVLWCSECVYEE